MPQEEAHRAKLLTRWGEPMATHFDGLVRGAIEALYCRDMFPTLILCDYLDDHGDKRGKRLRARLKRMVNDVGAWESNRFPSMPDAMDYCDEKAKLCRTAMVSYIIRLCSIRGDESLPRTRVTNPGYGTVQPA